MSFNSLQFMLFLPSLYLVFYMCPDPVRWMPLLAASLLFYASFNLPYLLVVLAVVILLNYASGLLLSRFQKESFRTAVFWGSVAANLLILGFLKYLPASLHKPFVSLGVSYFIFQAVSYLADVNLGVADAERHLGFFALYLSFFPKLLQGPIERAGDLLPQLRKPYLFDYHNMRSGMLLFMWGVYKKAVIADRLAPFVDRVYNDVHTYRGLPLLCATYLYALQIFFDFSGYTDMALGMARLFNINLTQNFNTPYLATSVAEFWRRWHISFSSWILNYVFRPLQMKWRNLGNYGTALALTVAFTASGIWHGATWGFLAWGGLHGCYLAASVFYKPLQKKIYRKIGLEKSRIQRVWQTAVTFNLVSFAWIFFRANSVSDAAYVVAHMFDGVGDLYGAFWDQKGCFKVMVLLLLVVLARVIIRHNTSFEANFYQSNWLVRWTVYISLVLMILTFNTTGSKSFIYYYF